MTILSNKWISEMHKLHYINRMDAARARQAERRQQDKKSIPESTVSLLLSLINIQIQAQKDKNTVSGSRSLILLWINAIKIFLSKNQQICCIERLINPYFLCILKFFYLFSLTLLLFIKCWFVLWNWFLAEIKKLAQPVQWESW